MYTQPYKEEQHISQHDINYFGKRFDLVPGKTLSGYYPVRHRTKLEHPCWFSKKPHIQKLSVQQCIENYPNYMLWIYNNLHINWSVRVIEQMEKVKLRMRSDILR